jgi:hypothetical protein
MIFLRNAAGAQGQTKQPEKKYLQNVVVPYIRTPHPDGGRKMLVLINTRVLL